VGHDRIVVSENVIDHDDTRIPRSFPGSTLTVSGAAA
jgi:hypothetical protein